MNLPCKDCITYVICKQRFIPNLHNDYIGPVTCFTNGCLPLKEYFSNENSNVNFIDKWDTFFKCFKTKK